MRSRKSATGSLCVGLEAARCGSPGTGHSRGRDGKSLCFSRSSGGPGSRRTEANRGGGGVQAEGRASFEPMATRSSKQPMGSRRSRYSTCPATQGGPARSDWTNCTPRSCPSRSPTANGCGAFATACLERRARCGDPGPPRKTPPIQRSKRKSLQTWGTYSLTTAKPFETRFGWSAQGTPV